MLGRVERNVGFMLVLVVLALLAAVAWSLFYRWQHTTTVRLGEVAYSTIVADTEAARSEGLSKRAAINSDEGMLLVYPRDGKWAIWMDHMRFAIDIIWLDKDKRIVHITKNVSPDTYPETFTPSKPARYVLELAAGSVDREHIAIGQLAHFELQRR